MITITGEPKEIAALVLAVQEQQISKTFVTPKGRETFRLLYV